MDARDPPILRRLDHVPPKEVPEDVAAVDGVRREVVVVDHAAGALDREPQALIGEPALGIVGAVGLARRRMLQVLAHPATRGGNVGTTRTVDDGRSIAREGVLAVRDLRSSTFLVDAAMFKRRRPRRWCA